jgi:Carboxypeptidase regulatory-like domain
MRGSVCLVSRVLNLSLAILLGLGTPCWPQESQTPPPKPPQQAPSPPPAQPPQAEEPPTAPEGTATPGESPESPVKEEAPAKKGATLKGRVLAVDRKTPVSAAVVYAVSPDDSVISSQPSDAKGSFLLDALHPGTYRLAVESEGGLFILENPVGITSAQTFTVNLATVPAGAATAGVPGVAAPTRGFCYIVQERASTGTTFWRTPKGIVLLAATAGAVGLILANRGGNEKQVSVSPSVP